VQAVVHRAGLGTGQQLPSFDEAGMILATWCSTRNAESNPGCADGKEEPDGFL
jgi:hypothetical protein